MAESINNEPEPITKGMAESKNNEPESVTNGTAESMNSEPESVTKGTTKSMNSEPESVTKGTAESMNSEPESVTKGTTESMNSELESITKGTKTMLVADSDESGIEAGMVQENAKSDENYTKTTMLDRVANSDAHFKHQQRGEPDLTYKEKYDIAEKVLNEKPAIFLSRYGQYLAEEDLSYFDFLKSDYVIDFHLKDIKQHLDNSKSKVVIRNRRYSAMEKMLSDVSDGSYFSDEEMKSRDPLLYEQLVGQYLTDEERQERIDKSDTRISTVLSNYMDAVVNNAVYDLQKEIEDTQMEESDEEENEEEEDNDMEVQDVKDDKKPEIPEEEKLMLRHEFMTTMQLRFLDGKDADFDYGSVDRSVEYDALDLQGQDAEDKYFDQLDDET